jgi:uncharacterized protein YqjF (DUF2071 family)
MSSVFLKARWENLIMANYIIDPGLLKPYLPKHTELDYYNGNTYVSLVGFMFKGTQILRMKIPFHRTFEEVNLRFYVRYNDGGQWKRGVVFIREIVPKYAIVFIANNIYHEKYRVMKMQHFLKQDEDEIYVGYLWKYKGHWNKLEVIAESRSHVMKDGSEEQFIAHHYWGYSKYNSETTFEYEVQHPFWKVYPIKKTIIDCDFAALYGNSFSFLSSEKPSSVFFADGSGIAIFKKRNLSSFNL